MITAQVRYEPHDRFSTGQAGVKDKNSNIRDEKMHVSEQLKSRCLQYIKQNFGKISQRGMAQQLKLGKTTVNRWAAELGLRHQKYTVNEHFFDIWTEESAYILGYIFADGNISWNPEKSYRALTITAAAKDVDHLDRIRKLLGSTKPLLYAEKTKSYRLIVNSEYLCKRLMKLGVIPRKSLVVTFPTVPFHCLRHFIRGIVDGDGTVSYHKRKRSPYLRIVICSGSQPFIQRLVFVVNKDVGIVCVVRRSASHVYVAQYTCSRAKKFGDYVYKNATIFLKRKFDQYKIGLEAKNGT